MQEVLEEARRAERDNHRNRGDGAEIRKRLEDNPGGVSPTDVKSGTSYTGTTFSHFS